MRDASRTTTSLRAAQARSQCSGGAELSTETIASSQRCVRASTNEEEGQSEASELDAFFASRSLAFDARARVSTHAHAIKLLALNSQCAPSLGARARFVGAPNTVQSQQGSRGVETAAVLVC